MCSKIGKPYRAVLSLGWAFCLWPFIGPNLSAQVSDKEFRQVYQSIQTKRLNNRWIPATSTFQTEDSTVMVETQQLLDNLFQYMEDEHRLNGNGRFAFSGHETTNDNLFRVEAGISMDQGLYPYELDFSTSLQTQLKNGSFQENVSNIDISFDFHPFLPDPVSRKRKLEQKIETLKVEMEGPDVYKEEYQRLIDQYTLKLDQPSTANGLWMENYVIAKRFNDDYLGIDQRYEIGGGFIFSLFSKALTAKGRHNRDEMNQKPSYEIHGKDLVRCLQSCIPIQNSLQLSESEVDIITKTRHRFQISNRKQYSKLRLSLLLGVYYELEKNTINKTFLFNQKDTSISHAFEPSNTFRWELRPGLVWRPKDGYKLKLYSFLKLPFDHFKVTTTDGKLTDVRDDYFLDVNTSFDIRIEEHFEIGLYYRWLYDNAPRALIFTQNDGSSVLVTGEKSRSSFGISFSFGF